MQKIPAQIFEIDSQSDGQRLDNFLIKKLKRIPKSKIYKIIRSGEVRVNGSRCKPLLKLKTSDKVRTPPLFITIDHTHKTCNKNLNIDILFEDDNLLIINKAAKIAVHSGSGNSFGIIDYIKFQRPDLSNLTLVHRLDKDTTGILIIAKNREALLSLQKKWEANLVEKRYIVLVDGIWPKKKTTINAPILDSKLNGKRYMKVDPKGKPSITKFKVLRYYKNKTLLFAWPITGRTHQIRVHTKHMGMPIVGDSKYNKNIIKLNLFLHASAVKVKDSFSIFSNKGIVCKMTSQQLQYLIKLSNVDA
jgi:23S rRNA pseudouridine955/2504/2580 synthase